MDGSTIPNWRTPGKPAALSPTLHAKQVAALSGSEAGRALLPQQRGVLNGICGSFALPRPPPLSSTVDQLKSGDILSWATGPMANTRPWPPCPRAGWRWWPACRSARSIFAKANRLGKNGRPVCLTKGWQQSAILTAVEWACRRKFPCALFRSPPPLRLSRPPRHPGDHLVAPVAYPAHELAALYAAGG